MMSCGDRRERYTASSCCTTGEGLAIRSSERLRCSVGARPCVDAGDWRQLANPVFPLIKPIVELGLVADHAISGSFNS